MPVRYIDEMDIRGKRVFIRVDFNVPMDKLGNITDDTRIRSHLSTINFALDERAKIILASHMGRPKGHDKKYSLKPIAKRLSRLIDKEVKMAPDCIGSPVEQLVEKMKEGDVLLLENLRFHSGEEKNDDEFAAHLARLADVYINDAFAVLHRAHASTFSIVKCFDECGGGFVVKQELTYFHQAMDSPSRPLVVIMGGAKVSGKLEVLTNLIKKVDKLIIGGGMAFTFLKSMGHEVGKSLVEKELLGVAAEIMETARQNHIKLYLPIDCVIAEKMTQDAETKVVPIQEIPKDWMALDIGPASTMLFREVLQDAKTIIWNGPMGAFEIDMFSRGTYAMVENVANSYALTIVGGGDTDVAVKKLEGIFKMSYVSTGGGAFIELLGGKKLPGIEALETKYKE